MLPFLNVDVKKNNIESSIQNAYILIPPRVLLSINWFYYYTVFFKPENVIYSAMMNRHSEIACYSIKFNVVYTFVIEHGHLISLFTGIIE